MDSNYTDVRDRPPEVSEMGRWILKQLAAEGPVAWRALQESVALELGQHLVGEILDYQVQVLQQLGLAKRFPVPSHPEASTVRITPSGRRYLGGQSTGGVVPEELTVLQAELDNTDPGSPEWEWIKTRIEVKNALLLGEALASLRDTATQLSAEGTKLTRLGWCVSGAFGLLGVLLGALLAQSAR